MTASFSSRVRLLVRMVTGVAMAWLIGEIFNVVLFAIAAVMAVHRSPEEWHGRALDGSGLYQFFEAAYPGERDFERRLEDWDRQLREIHAGKRAHLDTWNQLTYDLASMTRDDHGRLRLDCKLGTYFHSLSTSEALDPELTEAYAAWPDSDPATVWPRLERRAWLHERVLGRPGP